MVTRLSRGPAAVSVYSRSAEARAHEIIRTLFAFVDERPADSMTMTSMSQTAMRLTHAEAQEAMAELREVAQRWVEHGRERAASRGADSEDRVTYLAMLTMQPYPERLGDLDS